MEENKLKIMPKLPRGEDGYRTFSIRIRNTLVDELDRMSFATRRSRNELIGLLLEFAIQNAEIGSKTEE